MIVDGMAKLSYGVDGNYKQEYIVIGQRNFEVQIQVFSFGEHMSILDKIMLRKCAYGKGKTQLEQRMHHSCHQSVEPILSQS